MLKSAKNCIFLEPPYQAFFNDLKDGTHPTIFPTPVDQEKPLPLSINGSFGQR
jgi:hypothetical protein